MPDQSLSQSRRTVGNWLNRIGRLQERRWSWIAGISVIIAIAVFNWARSPYSSDVLSSDFANYSIAILQFSEPDLFAKDPLWRTGSATQTFWASGGLYMRINQWLYTFHQGHWSYPLRILNTASFSLMALGLYWLFSKIDPDFFANIVFAVAIASVIPTDLLYIPTGLYFAFVSLIATWLLRWLILPGLEKQSVSRWRILFLGFVVGLSPSLINSVNGLSFLLWLGAVTGLQALLRQMPWTVFLTFWAGVIPPFSLGILLGTGGAYQMTAESANWYVGTIFFARADVVQNSLVFSLISLVAAATWWITKARWAKSVFVISQVMIWLVCILTECDAWRLCSGYLLCSLSYRIWLGECAARALVIGITATVYRPDSATLLYRLGNHGWHTYQRRSKCIGFQTSSSSQWRLRFSRYPA
jgi:hypothetical protein